MNVNYTEEQEMLRASARDFLEKECTESVIREVETHSPGYSPDLWQKIADLGWLGLVFPEQYGGSGMNLIDLAVLYEEFGRGMFVSPYTYTVICSGLTILEAGSEEQKSNILPKISEGKQIVVPALGESEFGDNIRSNPNRVVVTAMTDGNDYLINGIRLFINYANIADTFLVPARTKTGSDSGIGITLFLVDAGSPGIYVTRLGTIPGDNQCEVVFNDVSVPASNIVGELDNGWKSLSRSIQIESVLLAAQMLGAGEQLLKLSEEDYETRIESGISDEVKHHNEEYLAQLKKDIEDCRWTTYQAVRKLANGESCAFNSDITMGWSHYTLQNTG